MNARRRLGAILMVTGLVVAASGTIGGLVEGSRAGSPSRGSATTPVSGATPSAPGPTIGPSGTIRSATASPSPAGAASKAPSPAPDALVQAFVTNLITAYRSATVGSLAGQLHPAVIARYGEAACRTSLGGIAADPAYALIVKSISQPGAWDWTTDGRTSKITDTLTISVDVTRSGAPSSTEIHLVVLDGVVRWFSDCGTPLS